MAEYLSTTLSLTTTTGTWENAISDIKTALKKQRRPAVFRSEQLYRLTVDISKRIVTRRLPIDFGEFTGSEPTGIEYWRSISAEVWFENSSAFVDFSIRQADDKIHIEIWFPTKVYRSIFNFDSKQKEFNHQAKSDLICLFTSIAKTIGAAGFGYRPSEENSLFGPIPIDRLRDYVETGNRWFSKRKEFSLRIAGIAAQYISEDQFKYDTEDHPRYYRQNGYYFWDTLWPR